MKKAGGFTKRMVAILLSGMLAVGTIPGTALASEIQENTVQEEEAITTYTVTLDANGGYFENEWDDVLGETVESSEVLNKKIPVGEAVTTFPVKEQENSVVTFMGWSFERDGEIMSQGDEEYVPVDNCVLYAVWKSEEIVDNDDYEAAEDVDKSAEEDTCEDNNELGTEDVSETEETATQESKQTGEFVEEELAQESDETVDSENIEKTMEEEQTQEDNTATQEKALDTHNETITAPGTSEPVSSDAVTAEVASGTCGDNLTWVLDGGTLTISGTGKMSSYSEKNRAPWYGSYRSQIKSIIVTDGVTSIGVRAFVGCDSITSVTIPGSVTEIGSAAFMDCSSLTSVTIPDRVTSIGASAFNNCISLTSVAIPDSVTSIGRYAFNCCSSLTDVTISNNVTRIEERVFKGCSSLTSVIIPDSVTSIGSTAFCDCSSLTSVTIPVSVTSIGDYAFNHCHSLTSVIIPDSVTSIGKNAFGDCRSLTSVIIPDSVTSIRSHAFCDCSNLTNVIIGNKVESIWDSAFNGCSSLTCVIIPVSVRYIFGDAFRGCSSLTSVTIPDGVTDIWNAAFYGCTGLADIYYYGTEDQWKSIGKHYYNSCLTNATIHYNSKFLVTLTKEDKTQPYTGTEIKPVPIVLGVDGNNLINGEDYSLSYSDNIKPGTATITVTGLGDYAGQSAEITFEIYATSEWEGNTRITLEDKYVLYENNQQDIIIRADVHSEDVVPNASNMSWLFGAYSGTSITPGSLSVEGGPTDYIASYSASFSGAGEYEIKTILYNNENMEKKLAEASAVLHVLDLHAVGMPHVTDNVRKVSVAWTGVDDAEEYELQFTRIRTDEMGRESTYNINPIVTAETQYCLKTAAVLPGDTFKVTIVPVSHGLKGSSANIVDIYVQDDLESCVNELVAAMDDFLTTMNDEAERQRVSESPEEIKEKNTSAIASGARSENMITTELGTTDAELSAIYQGYSKFIVDHFTDYVKMENIDLSNNWTQIESAFVEYVQNNLNHEEETYEINGYTVKVVTTGYGNAIDGTIVLNKDGLQKQIVHISSTTDSVQQLMTKFSKNMQDIMEAAMYDALTSVINEIGDKTGIKDWTEAKAKSAFNTVLTALRNKGFGNILDNIQKMCNIYKAANSVLDILKADSVSEANKKAKSCYETLQKIEITTATAEYSTMTAPIKKAFDKVLDKRKALEKALQYMYGGSSGSEWTSGGGIGGEVSGVDDPESDEENAAYNVSNATVTGVSAKTYTGKAITQSLTVKIGSTILTPGTDYTVSYKNNTNAGTATVTVTGKGNYTGTKTVSFIINKAPQSITIKSTASSIDVGKTATVSITGAKGTKSYKASDTSIATVNASTGVVTGKKAGTVTITATSAATSNYNAASKTIKITVNKVLKKPGNCHFTKWTNSKYTSCRISWNKVDGAEGYQTLLSWTDGSHASETIVKSNILYRDCTVVANHVSQMKVRAFYTAGGKRVYGPWSNVDYITPSPAKLTTKNASSGTNLKMNISWNIIYGCNGYNVFITTNPNGTWYWNQSTSEKATATSASIVKCGGAKLKKNTRYYVRIVTRRKRNGVFCTVPMPASNTYIGSFIIK